MAGHTCLDHGLDPPGVTPDSGLWAKWWDDHHARFSDIQRAVVWEVLDRVRAKANVQDTLVKYPDIACLVGLWSYNGPAIINAVKEAGKTGSVKIVCFDEEDETLAGVKDGIVFATVVQQPFEFGRQAMTVMAKYLRGDKSVVPAGKQIFVPTLKIQKDNVEEFQTKLNKLRGRS